LKKPKIRNGNTSWGRGFGTKGGSSSWREGRPPAVGEKTVKKVGVRMKRNEGGVHAKS